MIQTLDEAIKHCEEKAVEQRINASHSIAFKQKCSECASEHEQLAEWLKKLQRLESIERHSMWFEYKGYQFAYVEDDNGCRVHISQMVAPAIGIHIKDETVPPYGKETFETWCICWYVDHAKEEAK